MKNLKLGVVAALAIGFLWQSATTVVAEDKYPSKQINWYIHSSAGGGTDIFSRTVALRLRRELKANIIIQTMSGGSGARMLNYLMEQPADGYTLNTITNSNLATMARGNANATRDDLIGIVRGCYDPQALVISTKDGGVYKDIQEVLAKAKTKDGAIKVGVAHMASIDHVAAHEFAKATGVKFEFVPFTGGGEIIVALLGNVIDVGVLNPSEFVGQFEAGNLKPAVFLVEERLKDFPDAPTAKELGYDVEAATWRGVVVKKGTPEPIVKILRDAFEKSMKHKIYQSYLKDNSMGPESIMIGQDWDAFLDKKWPVWKAAMTELGYIKK